MQFPAYIMKILYRSHDCRSNFFVSFKLQNSICYSALLNISILWKQAATEAPWNYSISFCQLTRHTYFCAGEMAERSNAAVLKTVEVKASGGSNPSLSAKSMNVLRKQAFLFWAFARLASFTSSIQTNPPFLGRPARILHNQSSSMNCRWQNFRPW